MNRYNEAKERYDWRIVELEKDWPKYIPGEWPIILIVFFGLLITDPNFVFGILVVVLAWCIHIGLARNGNLKARHLALTQYHNEVRFLDELERAQRAKNRADEELAG